MKQFRYAPIAAAMTAMAFAIPAHAADNAMKVCGAKYQAAKTARTLPAGQTWNQFLAQCRTGLATTTTTATATTTTPTKKVVATKTVTTHGQPTAAQQAMYARERQCGAQWKADKAADKVPAGQTWPQYWSACNKRMK